MCADCSSGTASSAPVASFQGGLLSSQGEFRKQHWEAFARRLDQCQCLGDRHVGAGRRHRWTARPAGSRARADVSGRGRRAGRPARRAAGPRVSSRAAFANNLQTAAALVAEIGSPHLGICLDVFHYYVGPSKAEDLGYLSAENLFHVQLCDLAGVPRELATDADRILPGDGDFQLGPLVDRLRRSATTATCRSS